MDEVNKNRTRWYGIRKGDIVSVTFNGKQFVGEVIHLYAMDNNRVRIKHIDGHESDWPPEWCNIITKVEDKEN